MTLEIDRHLGRPVSPDEILDQLSSTGQKTLTLADVRSMYERFKEKYEGTDLFVLLDRLISPVLEKEVTLTSSKVNLKAVERTSSLGEQSADVVNFAYNSRYVKNGGVTHPYFILAPHVEDFVVSSGINPVEIQGVVPSESEYATGIRNKFKEYWFPKGDPSQQPRVYLAPWTVSD